MVGCGLGEALEPALQGLVTYLTDSAENAQLFTTVALCDTLAELTGGPLTARLLAIGRRDGHPSDGICFLVSAVSTPPIPHHFQTKFASVCSQFCWVGPCPSIRRGLETSEQNYRPQLSFSVEFGISQARHGDIIRARISLSLFDSRS
jgi:hypothetical protein